MAIEDPVIGETVEIRWTNCHRSYRGTGRVVTVNRKSIWVELDAPVASRWEGYSDGYPAGQRIHAPRPGTLGNGVFRVQNVQNVQNDKEGQ